MEIAALIIRRPFVSEQVPDRRVTVEVKDEVRSQRLKEGNLLDSLKRLQPGLSDRPVTRPLPGGCKASTPSESKPDKSWSCTALSSSFQDDMLVELVGKRCYAGTWSVKGNELFDESTREATVFVDLRSRRTGSVALAGGFIAGIFFSVLQNA